MRPSVKRRSVHRLDRAIPTSAKFNEKIKPTLKHPESCQLKTTLLDFRADGIVNVVCFFLSFFCTPEAEDCTPQKCKTYFSSYKVYSVLLLTRFNAFYNMKS